jgi:hypothetical protein
VTSLQRGASVVQGKKQGWPPLLLVFPKDHELVASLSGPSARCKRGTSTTGGSTPFHIARFALSLQLPTLRRPAPMAGENVKLLSTRSFLYSTIELIHSMLKTRKVALLYFLITSLFAHSHQTES